MADSFVKVRAKITTKQKEKQKKGETKQQQRKKEARMLRQRRDGISEDAPCTLVACG
jgi:hypothetical protein